MIVTISFSLVRSVLSFTCSLEIIYPYSVRIVVSPLAQVCDKVHLRLFFFREQYNHRLQKLNLCKNKNCLPNLPSDGTCIVLSCRKGAFGDQRYKLFYRVSSENFTVVLLR